MRSVTAHRLLTALLLSLAMIVTAPPANAGGYRHHGWHHGHAKHYGHRPYKHYKHHAYRHHYHHGHHHGHRHHRRHGNSDIVLGAGILGGAIIVGSLLSQPRYVSPPPPPVYYTPPPDRKSVV